MPKKKTASKEADSPTVTTTKKQAIDPEILRLRKKHHEEVQAYLKTKDSTKRLKRMIDNDLPRLSDIDKIELRDHLVAMNLGERIESESTSEDPPTVWPSDQDIE